MSLRGIETKSAVGCVKTILISHKQISRSISQHVYIHTIQQNVSGCSLSCYYDKKHGSATHKCVGLEIYRGLRIRTEKKSVKRLLCH